MVNDSRIYSMLALMMMMKMMMMMITVIQGVTHTGLYPSRTSSISASVRDVTCCFSEISSDKILLDDNISMAVSSSKMLP